MSNDTPESPRVWTIYIRNDKPLPAPSMDSEAVEVIEKSHADRLVAERDQADKDYMEQLEIAVKANKERDALAKELAEVKARRDELKKHLELVNEGWVTTFQWEKERDQLLGNVKRLTKERDDWIAIGTGNGNAYADQLRSACEELIGRIHRARNCIRDDDPIERRDGALTELDLALAKYAALNEKIKEGK